MYNIQSQFAGMTFQFNRIHSNPNHVEMTAWKGETNITESLTKEQRFALVYAQMFTQGYQFDAKFLQ